MAVSAIEKKKLDPRIERLLLLILEARQARRLRDAIEGRDPDGEDLERIQRDRGGHGGGA